MKIIFYPPKNSKNDYMQLITDSLKKAGCVIINEKCKNDFSFIIKSLFCTKKNRPSIVHLNFIEENSVSNSIRAKIKCLFLLSYLKIMRLKKSRIVRTMHNARSHREESSNYDDFITKLLKLTDMVLIHASESELILSNKYHYNKDKILFVPHGNYSKEMNKYLKEKKENENNKLRLLFFGLISKYKGVEDLARLFEDEYIKSNCSLIICGFCSNLELKESIYNLTKNNDSIITNLSFVSNEKLAEYFSESDVTILPYEKESMQNSGAVIMSLTCATPVIIPIFGYIKDIRNNDFIISCDYSTKEERIIALKKAIYNVIDMFKQNKNIFSALGKKAKDFAEKELNRDTIGLKIVERYKQLEY